MSKKESRSAGAKKRIRGVEKERAQAPDELELRNERSEKELLDRVYRSQQIDPDYESDSHFHSIEKPKPVKKVALKRPAGPRRKKETGLVNQILKGRGPWCDREELTAPEFVRRVKAMVEAEGVRPAAVEPEDPMDRLMRTEMVPLDLFDITDAMEIDLPFPNDGSLWSDDLPWRDGL